MKPDFNNCILNVTSSIMKKYNVESKFPSIPLIDEKIKNSKHVFFIILDGLGKNIIELNLDNDSFIKSHVSKWITSVYPPTTVAATTAALSGVNPGISGWIGWHQYFKDINADVELFSNTNTYTKEKFDFRVTDTYIPYTPFYKKFENIKCRELFPSFRPNGFNTFDEMKEEIIKISKTNEETYTYCYWDDPDHCLHDNGINNDIVKGVIKDLDRNMKDLYERSGSGTSIIMIADHGLVDVEFIYLEDYPDFLDTLELLPSIEPRTTAFKVNDKTRFELLFNKYFGKYFELYTSEEFIKSGLLGECSDSNSKFLLDYVSVAIDKYGFDFKRSDFTMKAAHAGGTKEEMIIPLVILEKV